MDDTQVNHEVMHVYGGCIRVHLRCTVSIYVRDAYEMRDIFFADVSLFFAVTHKRTHADLYFNNHY